MIRIPPHTRNLKPYKAGKPIEELAREKKLSRIVKLASNENPLGTSPKALAALADVSSSVALHRYVDPASTDLVLKLAEKTGRAPDEIICGHGTDALLAYIINAFTVEGDEILTSRGTFIGIYVSTNKLARVVRQVPLKDYAFDLSALLDAISDSTRIIYLANPNNPTGTMFTADEFESFMAGVPHDVLVILDEAYWTYAGDRSDYPDGLRYHYENMIVTRTLSKAYGLAGLRVGFAVGPEYLIHELYKVRLPFEPNELAQIAAMAALDDDEFLERTVKTNRMSLKVIQSRLDELGIPYVPTAANFIMMVMPSEEFAATFFQECLNRGLIVRHLVSFGIPNGVRINSGTEDETKFAMDIIEDVYHRLSKKLQTEKTP